VIPDGVKAVGILIGISNAVFILKQQAMKFAAELKRDQILGALTEDIEHAVKHKARLRDLTFQRLANDLAEKRYGFKKTNEDVNMMVMLIEKEQGLIERGMKMFPAWTATPEMKASFPDFNKALVTLEETDLLGSPVPAKLLPPAEPDAEPPA
jgi:hypothetical protein